MKRVLYTPIKGRRDGDTDVVWKFDWRKFTFLAASILAFLSWVVVNCQRASSVPAIWQKIDRMDDRWEQRHEDLLYKLLDMKKGEKK